jgi:hypothetical protein
MTQQTVRIDDTINMCQEILRVFRDTCSSPVTRDCNIAFLTFVQANYTDGCIKDEFPALYEFFKLGELDHD